MNLVVLGLFFLSVIIFFVIYMYELGHLAWFVVIALLTCVYFVWTPEAERKKQQAAEQIIHAEEITPRKLLSADGCTVYKFKPEDHWLYFTKCDNAQTTTQNEYTVQHGKYSSTETLEIKTK